MGRGGYNCYITCSQEIRKEAQNTWRTRNLSVITFLRPPEGQIRLAVARGEAPLGAPRTRRTSARLLLAAAELHENGVGVGLHSRPPRWMDGQCLHVEVEIVFRADARVPVRGPVAYAAALAPLSD